jgi:hypothetical protein
MIVSAGPRPTIPDCWLQFACGGAHACRLPSETHGEQFDFPNVDGKRIASLSPLKRFLEEDQVGAWTTLISDYGYVPGLRTDDPPGLVLFYFRRMTKYRGPFESWSNWTPEGFPCWRSAKWAVMDSDYREHYMDTPEFLQRMSDTLGYLESQNRPFWRTIREEQESFLRSSVEPVLDCLPQPRPITSRREVLGIIQGVSDRSTRQQAGAKE